VSGALKRRVLRPRLFCLGRMLKNSHYDIKDVIPAKAGIQKY
jgi:hypothetical protein